MRYYMHSVPGRLRIKIPAIKGHPEKARNIQALLSEIEGIESIRANTATGSIVVKYEPGRLLSERIPSILTENGHFDKTQTFSMDHAVHESSSKAGHVLSKAFCGWAVGRALEGTGLSFLAALI
ncbi:MAG: heavy-metal-associated domain-containing protein [Deltaproteobacteria bacterium]|nr:heavy-metal-associated domain-containing protein [Deltaproteobacteria bacterium]